MLCTVSTVKDSLDNVRLFVERNLAGGADHVFVMLEGDDAEVVRYLDDHPHATCVHTNDSWWNGRRPDALNVRQRVNANVVKAVLSVVGSVDWLVHVDGDEWVRIDRSVLDGLAPEVEQVTLAPLESVSQLHPPGGLAGLREFKRLLGEDDLALLWVLGVIARPKNVAYFRGHVDGKSGLRPRLDRWINLHHVVDTRGERCAAYRHERLQVRHVESWSGDEFVRKWTSLLAAGPRVKLRPLREPTALAFAALMAKGLPPEKARHYANLVYQRTIADDVETLRDLGLLVEVDPDSGRHDPQPLHQLDQVRLLLRTLAPHPKRAFLSGAGAAGATKVLRAAAQLLPAEPQLAARIDAACREGGH